MILSYFFSLVWKGGSEKRGGILIYFTQIVFFHLWGLGWENIWAFLLFFFLSSLYGRWNLGVILCSCSCFSFLQDESISLDGLPFGHVVSGVGSILSLNLTISRNPLSSNTKNDKSQITSTDTFLQ